MRLFLTLSLPFPHSFICDSEREAAAVRSQLHQILRPMYSNPPLHGSLLAQTILGDPQLHSLWLSEVKVRAGRLPSLLRTGDTRCAQHTLDDCSIHVF